jgi:hypothetical protein
MPAVIDLGSIASPYCGDTEGTSYDRNNVDVGCGVGNDQVGAEVFVMSLDYERGLRGLRMRDTRTAAIVLFYRLVFLYTPPLHSPGFFL